MTRLPIPVDAEKAQARGAQAAWAYPVAGGLAALLAGLGGLGFGALGLPDTIVAGLALAVLILITGALHEDGLADTADGLWGGWTLDRRLEIMKDSHIGSYGVLALTLSVLLRWACLVALVPTGAFLPALVVAGMLSRAGMIAVMGALRNARKGGLSATTGRPQTGIIAIGGGLAVLATLLCFGFAATFALMITLVFVTSSAAAIANRKIGGQTGDTLGATQQINEIALLACLAALLS
ncbi:UNVERIFIED_CONTAM: hypothetical protein GTU68_022192 [Idotea baltica]|nr:hypothetical protein [Idotea baltica]